MESRKSDAGRENIEVYIKREGLIHNEPPSIPIHTHALHPTAVEKCKYLEEKPRLLEHVIVIMVRSECTNLGWGFF